MGIALQEKMLCLSDWVVSVTEHYLKPALVKIAQQIKALTSPDDPVLNTALVPKLKQMKIVLIYPLRAIFFLSNSKC